MWGLSLGEGAHREPREAVWARRGALHWPWLGGCKGPQPSGTAQCPGGCTLAEPTCSGWALQSPFLLSLWTRKSCSSCSHLCRTHRCPVALSPVPWLPTGAPSPLSPAAPVGPCPRALLQLRSLGSAAPMPGTFESPRLSCSVPKGPAASAATWEDATAGPGGCCEPLPAPRAALCCFFPLPSTKGSAALLSVWAELSLCLCSACVFHLLMKAAQPSEVASRLFAGARAAKK